MIKYIEVNDTNADLNSSLVLSIMEKILNGRFNCGLEENHLKNNFGTAEFKEHINEFEPMFSFAYINIFTNTVEYIVISVLTKKRKPLYIVFYYDIISGEYVTSYSNFDIDNIKTGQYDTYKFETEINNILVNRLKDKRIGSIKAFELLESFDIVDNILYFEQKELDPLAKLIFNKCLESDGKMKVDADKITVLKYGVNCKKLEKIRVSTIHYFVNKKYYSLELKNEIKDCYLQNVLPMEEQQLDNNLISEYISIEASKDFVVQYQKILDEVQLSNARDEACNYFKSDKKFIFANEKVYLKEMPELAFIEFTDKVVVHTKRQNEFDKPIELDFDENVIANIKNTVGDAKTSFTHSKTKELTSFFEDAEKLLSGEGLSFEEAKNLAESLINKRFKELFEFDQINREVQYKLDLIKARYDEFKNINKEKINSVKNLMESVKDEASFFKISERLYNEIEELNDAEELYLKDDIAKFRDLFASVSGYNPNMKEVRRVYISKSVLKEIQNIDSDNRELKLLPILDSIINELKTLPGDKLGAYLLKKGLNFPINKDRSINKIRIINKQPFRLMFVYGSEFLGKASDNADSIYIFALTKHDYEKDIIDAAKSKPKGYVMNTFIIYPVKDKTIRIPETDTEQHDISRNFDDKPIVTFGCAGSGKTTVSIEQYVNIYWFNHLINSNKVNRDIKHEQVYITYHTGLCNNARRFLSEYSVEGNCYVLYDYFADFLDEKLDETKLLNETLFVDWFDNEFVKQSKKFKKGNIISVLNGKPDIARLVYTYYRGVFRGSRALYEYEKAKYLPHDKFMEVMKDESYLTNEEKESIYNVCLAFYEYTQTEGITGDNELALKVLRGRNDENIKAKKYECIIIDEVQDLTEIELLAIVSTLKEGSNKIYFFGDPHQSINPNLFDNSTINKVYSTLGRTECATENKPLVETYRTNGHLISYLQKLEQLRVDWIGATPGSIATKKAKCGADYETAWSGYVVPDELYSEALSISSSNCMIITPSEKVRRELLAKYENADPNRVITIYEAKGMEWDSVILYNIFSDYKDYFVDMISKNGKARKSTIHRMTFNKYYVACTRSLKSFVIVEEDKSLLNEENQIFKSLISDFTGILTLDSLNRFISQDNTFEGWYKEAIQNFDNDNKSGFENACRHAEKLAITSDEKAKLAKLTKGDVGVLENLAETYMQEHNYEAASHIYAELTKKDKEKYHLYRNASTLLAGNPKHFKIEAYKIGREQAIINKYPEILPLILKNEAFIKRYKSMRYTWKSMLDKIERKK